MGRVRPEARKRTLTFASWNQVIDWLRRIDRLQRAAQSILSSQTSLVPERVNGIEPHRHSLER